MESGCMAGSHTNNFNDTCIYGIAITENHKLKNVFVLVSLQIKTLQNFEYCGRFLKMFSSSRYNNGGMIMIIFLLFDVRWPLQQVRVCVSQFHKLDHHKLIYWYVYLVGWAIVSQSEQLYQDLSMYERPVWDDALGWAARACRARANRIIRAEVVQKSEGFAVFFRCTTTILKLLWLNR